MNKKIDTIPADTMNALINWHWPGNVRELANFMERSVILSQGPVLRVPLQVDVFPQPPLGTAKLEASSQAFTAPPQGLD